MTPSSPVPPVPSAFRLIDSAADVDALVASLGAGPDGPRHSASVTVPTLVVTAVNQDNTFAFDLERIAAGVAASGEDARLVVIVRPYLTREFSAHMPPDSTPYNGAARIYPAHDRTWMRDPFSGDLLFTSIRADRVPQATDALLQRLRTVIDNDRGYDDLAALRRRQAEDAAPTGPVAFRGEFTAVSSPTVGMITSPDAPGMGMLRVDLDRLLPGAPVVIGSAFAVGDEVTGCFDDEGLVVSVDGLRPAEEMAGDLVRQRHYPAVVTQVLDKSQVKVQVVPGVESHLTRSGIGASVCGDVVTVQVQSVGVRNGRLQIVVGPAREDAPEVDAAPALRTGGPTWLHRPHTNGDGAAHRADPRAAGAAHVRAGGRETDGPAVSAGSVAELEGLRRHVPQLKYQVKMLEEGVADLRHRLSTSEDENHFAWEENDRLEQENDLLRGRLRSAGLALPDEVGAPGGTPTATAAGSAAAAARPKKRETRTVLSERTFIGTEFEDPAEQLRIEVLVAWAQQVDAADKADHPLRYRLGPEFLTSVTECVRPGESLRRKLPQVLAWAASGFGTRLTRRHPYRESEAGSSPQRVRHLDGARAFRADLETNTAAARRLHYWTLPDGSVEFHSVNHHDDYPAL